MTKDLSGIGRAQVLLFGGKIFKKVNTMSEQEKQQMYFEEYKLAIETQMHFNELLLKLRSFGITAVIAIFGYAVQSKNSTSIIACGIVLLIALAFVDLLYFFKLLLGAVDRSTEIEKKIPVNLTGAITKRVSRINACLVLIVFYVLILIIGISFLVYYWLKTT
jgi:hypothetical protein